MLYRTSKDGQRANKRKAALARHRQYPHLRTMDHARLELAIRRTVLELIRLEQSLIYEHYRAIAEERLMNGNVTVK